MKSCVTEGRTRQILAGTTVVQTVRAKVLDPVDVVVVGGGTAGVIAALAAARGGGDVRAKERGVTRDSGGRTAG